MDQSLVEDEFAVDLESGRRGRELDGSGSVSGDNQATLGEAESVVIDVKVDGVVDVNEVEKKLVKEKCKKISNKKAPKPPRPPRGPSLDAADEKLIREITELMMLKRIRTERIKALKKMKASKSSSSSNSLFATLFTVVFFCVILLQGISNRSSSQATLDGSLSSSAPEPGLISVQIASKAYAVNSSMLVYGSPSVVEQVSGQDTHEIANSASG